MAGFRTSSYRFAVGLILAAFLWLGACPPALAQTQPGDSLTADENSYGSGAGLELILTNSGFGLGGYLNRAVSSTASLIAETTLSPGKDEREFKFATYFNTTIPNKANYFLILPVQVGVVQRLFENEIEDNFRPYLQFTAGPAFGWEYPYFKDCNGNGKYDQGTAVDACTEHTYDALSALPRGHFRMGWGGLAALGAHFGRSTRVTQGVRVGYTFSYFSRKIQLLEPDIEGGSQRYFGTPIISVSFGRLF